MVSELRDAFRSLTRRPRFAVLVLVTLAIGIGASTAIFSIVHTVILKPLPFADPDRLVHIYENRPKGERFSRGAGQYFIVVRPATLHAWRTQSRSFASVEGYRRRGRTLGAAGDGGVPYHGSVSIERVTAGYFQTLGVRVLRGRPIDDRDDAGAPVVTVVNDTFARKFFPDADPIGQQFTVDMTSYEPRMTIVGVVEDNKMHGLDRAPYPLLYWSMSQLPSTNGWLVVRTHGQPEELADRVRTAVTRLDPELAIGDTAGLERVLRESTWRPRFAALLLALFAALGLFQAVAGIYAVMSYAVARRTQEVGLRVTLGARPREILSLILTHALRLAAAGLILGIAAALSLRQLVASQLFGVSSSDPTTLAAVSGIVLVVALAAAAVPAFRALRVDPVLTLRQQ
jgi:predicted permease